MVIDVAQYSSIKDLRENYLIIRSHWLKYMSRREKFENVFKI